MTSRSEAQSRSEAGGRSAELAAALDELRRCVQAEADRRGWSVDVDADTLLLVGGLLEGLSADGRSLQIRTKDAMPEGVDDNTGRTGVVVTYDGGHGRVLNFHARTFLGALARILAPRSWWLSS